MSIISIFLTAVGLAMDAFAASITIGINISKENKRKIALKTGMFFGGFQAVMPFIGWLLGVNFIEYIEKIDHWIAFVLLSFIGGKMIFESLKKDNYKKDEKEYSNKSFFLLAIATSIDALAVGVSFAFLNVNILYAVIMIGIVTMLLSIMAVYLGKVLGEKFKNKAELFGGAILIVIGIKILLEHLNIL